MKKYHLVRSAITLILLIQVLISCESVINNEIDSNNKLKSLTLNVNPAIRLRVTDTLQLNVTCNPLSITDSIDYVWKSSNPLVASVSEKGVLKALKIGTTIISAENLLYKKRVTTLLTVEKYMADIVIKTITLNKTEHHFSAINSETFQLTYVLEPANASIPTLSWSSSNNQVVKVSDTGLVSIIGGGNATIKAQAVDGGDVSAECQITVFGTGIKDARYDSGDDYYQIVYEPVTITVTYPDGTTGTQTWLDRNLGAKRAAITYDDNMAFGSYFQWGRKADGHEKVFWTLGADNKWTSSVTSVIAELAINRANTGHDDFITSTGDWASDMSNATNGLWGGKQQSITSTAPNYDNLDFATMLGDATQENNPCPPGYRVPTPFEVHLMMNAMLGETLKYNVVNTVVDVVNKLAASPMHFAATGNRANSTGAIANINTYIFLWTNAANSANNAFRFQATTTSAGTRLSAIQKANAYSIRCIKE